MYIKMVIFFTWNSFWFEYYMQPIHNHPSFRPAWWWCKRKGVPTASPWLTKWELLLHCRYSGAFSEVKYSLEITFSKCNLCAKMDSHNIILLPFSESLFFQIFHRVSKHEGKNKMSLSNLSTVFGPTLLHPAVADHQSPTQLMQDAQDVFLQAGVLYFLLQLAANGRNIRRCEAAIEMHGEDRLV